MALEYKESKKIALRTIILLAIITVIEVAIALVGKGYIIPDFHLPLWLMGLLMISLSLYKAIKIIFEFMHMSYEVPSFVKTVLLPMGLLIWAVIAFMWEGSDWKDRRSIIDKKNKDLEQVDGVGIEAGKLK